MDSGTSEAVWKVMASALEEPEILWGIKEHNPGCVS